MKSIIKYIGIFIIPFVLLMVSCDDDDKYPNTTADETVIYSIKIVNGGSDGSETIIGQVDEALKEISFPEVALDMDLTNVKFEAEVSDRASLDSTEYNFVVSTGDSQRKRTIAVVNGLRKREYFVTIRLDVPVYGADFTAAKMKVYDFSGNSTMYADLASTNTRSADMDLEHILIVSREGSIRPHLLKISDLKSGTINPILLNTTGVADGTFVVSSGRIVNNHIYICNLNTSMATTGKTKIYHWDKNAPDVAPTLLIELGKDQVPSSASGRYGDFMSVNLDGDGDGYIFVGNNPSPANIMRLKVTNYTTVSDPVFVTPSKFGGLWLSYNEVDGSPGSYLYTGHQSSIMLVDANGSVAHDLTTLTNNGGSDARVITFNQERYMVMNTVPGTGTVTVYDITKGETIAEALSIFEAGDKNALISYSLSGNVTAAVAAGSIGWAKDGDETLYLMGAAPGAGFVLLEFPKKVKETE